MKRSTFVLALFTLAACNSDRISSPSATDAAALFNNGNGNNRNDDDDADEGVGVVLTLSNQTAGNAVLVYNRDAHGTLTPAGSVPTNGTGTGVGLGSQGALAYSPDGRLLFVVNAGSNTVTSFRVNGSALSLVNTVSSGGTTPISLTADNGLLYVLNTGGTGNISGLRYAASGTLTPIAGSTRALSTNASGPAQISFNESGTRLVVTEKGANTISTYNVAANGIASAGLFTPSSGATPFGFAFRGDEIIVSEAAGGAPDATSVSSYRIGQSGPPTAVTASLTTGQTAACWVAVTGNGKFAYVANTGSGTISGFSVSHGGTLTPLDADNITAVTGAGTAPADLAVTHNSRYLYVRNGGNRTITALRIQGGHGSLTVVGTLPNLPAGTAGLLAR